MNRQTKRTLQRQGQAEEDAAPAAEASFVAEPPRSTGGATRGAAERASVGARLAQYFREVRAELAKVLWPKRSEVVNYSTVVLTTLVLIALLIFGLNYAFAQGVLHLYP